MDDKDMDEKSKKMLMDIINQALLQKAEQGKQRKAEMDKGFSGMHELYESAIRGGFTEDQALSILNNMISKMLEIEPKKE